jgi:tetratricopeptide (TPR) repeat protein
VEHGETYRQMGRFEQALADFDKAIELDPSYQWAIGQRGETYRQMGRFEQALADFDKAIELDPSDDWIQYLQSLVHLSLGQTSEAYSYLRNAVEQARKTIALGYVPSNDSYNITVYLAAEGRFEEAKQEFDNALAIYPSQPWGAEAIDDLRDLAKVQGVDSAKVDELIEIIRSSLSKQT